MLNMIVAMAESSRVIGKNNQLPWTLGTDLRRFKEITTGHTVIMGRKTWESIPVKFRPLSNRQNIVLTRNPSFEVPEGVGVCSSFEEALSLHHEFIGGEIFVIGGESLFVEALPVADRLYITLVQYGGEGDVFFPAVSEEEFEMDPSFKQEVVPSNEKDSAGSRFFVLKRKPQLVL